MNNSRSKEALTTAINKFRTLRAFAAALGVRYQVVQQWLANGVPPEYCPRIERITSREVLCEDLCDKVDWAYVREGGPPQEHDQGN